MKGISARMKKLLIRLILNFDKVDEKFDKIDARFDKVDEKFDKIDAQFDSMRQLIFWTVTGGVAFLTIMLGFMTYILKVIIP